MSAQAPQILYAPTPGERVDVTVRYLDVVPDPNTPEPWTLDLEASAAELWEAIKRNRTAVLITAAALVAMSILRK